jgi:ribonuclease HI
VLYADGGARESPATAAIGYLLEDDTGVRLVEHGEAIGATSATEAEYRALLAGLVHIDELGLDRVTARSDSRLLIEHLNGERQVRNPRLVDLKDAIVERRTCIGTVLFEWIPASANQSAHQLVARVLESAIPWPPAARRGRGDGAGNG